MMKNIGKDKKNKILWPSCWVPQFLMFLNLFISTVTKILEDPTENVVLHCKVQEYLIGQGKGRNDNTINNAWYSSKKDWNFVGRGLSVGKGYMLWPNITLGFGDDTLILTDFICFSSYSLFKIQCCVCTDAFQILCEPAESKAFRLSFSGRLVCSSRESLTYNMMLAHIDISLICFLYTTGPRQSNTQMTCCISLFTGN